MSEKTEKAKELFLAGYSCSQAVVGAFCEDLGLSFDTAMRLSSSFGGGMGRLREVCGALSGVFLLAGWRFGYTSPTEGEAKAALYRRIQELAADFREQNGSIICRELLGKCKEEKESATPDARTPDYYKTRPCLLMVECGAALAEEMLKE